MGNCCHGSYHKDHARHLARVKERRRSSRGKATPDIMTYPQELDPMVDEFVAKVPHDKSPAEIKDSPRRKRRVSCTPSIGAIDEEVKKSVTGSNALLKVLEPHRKGSLGNEEEVDSYTITTPSEYSAIVSNSQGSGVGNAPVRDPRYIN